MNDDFLTKFHKQPRPEFAAALYQRISKPMHTQPKTIALRIAILTLSLFAVLGLVLLVSPPVRAFAQNLIWHIGGYNFSQGNPASSLSGQGSVNIKGKLAGTPDAAELERMVIKQTQIALINKNPSEYSTQVALDVQKKNLAGSQQIQSAAEAAQQAGFSVLLPFYIPAGYTLGPVGWTITSDPSGVTVHPPIYIADQGKAPLFITEFKPAAGYQSLTYVRPQIVNVTVRGQPGLWLPADHKTALVWVENSITFTITCDGLSLDEALKVADSLGK
jgi:hypothetical protein